VTDTAEEYMPINIRYEENPMIVIVSNPNGGYTPPNWNREESA
jgi:hypothetical protein